MMRRRFRRPGSKCIWAIDTIMTSAGGFADTVYPAGSPGGITYWFQRLPLLQAGRVNWLLTNRMRSRMTVTGISMWLNFWYSLPASGGTTGLPDTFFYIKPFTEDATGNTNVSALPYSLPNFPSAITNWDETVQSDGTDDFMWRHWIKGMTDGISPGTTTAFSGGVAGTNTLTGISGGANPEFVRNDGIYVKQVWQPDVRIKTRRTLHKDQGLVFVMYNTQSTAPAAQCNLQFKALIYGR